jgi:hypothetical protein
MCRIFLRGAISSLTIILGAVSLLQVATPLHATPILDQSFTSGGSSSLGNAIGECCDFAAQTFTPGLSGLLTEVRVDIIGTGQLHIDVESVSAGVPNGVVLGSATLGTGNSSLSDPIIFVQLIQVVAGMQYAIIASEIGGVGSWGGGTGDPYSGGELRDLLRGTSTWINEGAGYDAHFQTYVEVPHGAVPEPGTLPLFIVAMSTLAGLRLRRNRQLSLHLG